jgi:large subunit ribosomal protein L4
VVTGFTEGDAPRTRDALSVLLAATGTTPSAAPLLVVTETGDTLTWKSLRNVPGVHLLDSGQLNTYDVLVSDHVVFTEAALGQFLARSGFPGATAPRTPEASEASEAPEASEGPEASEAPTPPEAEDAES